MKTPNVLSSFLGDTEVQYLLYDGDGPTVVFVHSAGFNPWLWHPIARELADRYRILVPYFCDHRSTDPQKGGLHWPVLAHDLVRLCRYLDIEKPFMVGHSMGGGICILSHGILPDLAQKMILIEPIVFLEYAYKAMPDVSKHPLAGRAIKRRDTWKDHREAEAYLRSKPLFKKWDDEMFEIYLSHGLSIDASGDLTLTCSPKGEAALYMGSLAKDPWPLLPNISCPVLILEGENSESHTFLDLQKVTQAFPNGTYRIVPDAGHLVPMEKPKEILRIIQDFFP